MGVATFQAHEIPAGYNHHWPAGASRHQVVKGSRVVIGTLTLSNSYATGGDDLDISEFPLTVITGMAQLCIPTHNREGYTLELDSTDMGQPATKVLAFDSSGEVANTTDLSGTEFLVAVFGRT